MNKKPTENEIRERHDLMFRLWNSYWLEYIAHVFNRRIDTAINAVILISGATVFSDSNFGWLLGGVVAVLGGCNIAWKFGQRAQAAKEQAHRYNVLISESESANPGNDVVLKKLLEIEVHDSPVLECMDKPARNKACMSMGLKHRDHLSFSQKLVALLTVGIPR
ncbi:hypothetical protein HIU27_RS10930 [Escherichia coli]|uniref:hypothetical protein n=1 Tax=Escherichia coli TaxID=562 RepID=UPI000D122714|nr:hypothetical protein [Escherichia coli]EFK8902802.1 hypothetical protein [Escherichia coli]